MYLVTVMVGAGSNSNRHDFGSSQLLASQGICRAFWLHPGHQCCHKGQAPRVQTGRFTAEACTILRDTCEKRFDAVTTRGHSGLQRRQSLKDGRIYSNTVNVTAFWKFPRDTWIFIGVVGNVHVGVLSLVKHVEAF